MAQWREDYKKGKRRKQRFELRKKVGAAGWREDGVIVCNADNGPGNGTGLRTTRAVRA